MAKTKSKTNIKSAATKSSKKPLKADKKTAKKSLAKKADKITSSKAKNPAAKPNKHEVALITLLKETRDNLGLAKEKVAKRMDKSVNNITTLESTSTPSSPSIRNIFEYAKALGCQLNFSLTNLKEEKLKNKNVSPKARNVEKSEQRELEMETEIA